MSNDKALPYKDKRSYLWLFLGAIALAFSGLKLTVPIAAWLTPVFFLRFLRTQKILKGYLLLLLGLYIGWLISTLGTGPAFIIIIPIMATVLSSLPYLIDRFLAHRLEGILAVLFFPLISTAVVFLTQNNSPFGSFGALGYSQYNSPVLIQVASLTGIWGITFLVNWFGSVVNFAWEQDFDLSRIKKQAIIYASVLLLVLVYGGLRLAVFYPGEGTVRVAGINSGRSGESREIFSKYENASLQEKKDLQPRLASIQSRYLKNTVKEARAGAKIVVWPELAITVDKDKETEFLSRVRDIAKREGIYVVVGIGPILENDKNLFENKLLIIDPQGKIVLEHNKYGGDLGSRFPRGDGKLKAVESVYGTLSGVICWDLDFPSKIRQTWKLETDILFVPSSDGKEWTPLHSQMAEFRAIENGISIVRETEAGLSVTYDPYGRILSSANSLTNSDGTMVAEVPTQKVLTIYSVVGDIFAFVTIIASLVIISLAMRNRKAEKSLTKLSHKN